MRIAICDTDNLFSYKLKTLFKKGRVFMGMIKRIILIVLIIILLTIIAIWIIIVVRKRKERRSRLAV